MKVFISHKKEDEALARQVAQRLDRNRAGYYLDVLDPYGKDGPQLADYLRARLSECSDLIAVVSRSTKDSWWVPWEIGVANEKDFPLATYVGERCELPSFLKKWPYLMSGGDIDTYVRARKSTDQVMQYSRAASDYRARYAKRFFTNLRTALGQ